MFVTTIKNVTEGRKKPKRLTDFIVPRKSTTTIEGELKEKEIQKNQVKT